MAPFRKNATLCTFVLFSFSFNIARIFSTPIVNGNAKPIRPNFGEYPFHASLMQLGNRSKNYHSFCGGSLIHPRWVLTAAHCVQEDKYSRALKSREIYVALGSIYRNGSRAQILRVRKTIIYPNYLKTDRSDIGLLQLKKSAKLGPNVKLIQLHTNKEESLIKQTAYLTGFGVINDARQSPHRLRKAILHISDYSKCSPNNRYKNVEICAASTIAEGKACDGDSGGPLFIMKNKKRIIQIGIASYLARSSRCEMANNNSVHTKVSAYISWISKTTGMNFKKYNQH